MNTTVILGAGFSKNSGVPVQSEIPGLLISYGKGNGFENDVNMLLKKFMEEIYGYKGDGHFPNLDDIFTCIDISTNSGHHLGISYSPLTLRGIRRFLVYRVFSILENCFTPQKYIGSMIELLNKKSVKTRYIVLNWDNVLEKYLLMNNGKTGIDYCNGGINWEEGSYSPPEEAVKIMKLHGSCNWLYCDNCRTLYYDLLNKVGLIERAGFQKTDFSLLSYVHNAYSKENAIKSRLCRLCNDPVSSHIATFSYRKSFRANSFPDIWNEAESSLCQSDRWIFIGYSLPDADYEFKHLLKIAELKLKHMRKEGLEIDVVLLNSDKTIDKYKSFFGNKLHYICNGGIDEYSDYLKTL
ncbi:MAG: hypothetical protein N3I35_16745 [Clostridia bacterium]|nr:hypothetical protein [Clostridia bacterium]